MRKQLGLSVDYASVGRRFERHSSKPTQALHCFKNVKTLLILRAVQKQMPGWIWPTGHVLLTLGLNDKLRFPLLAAEILGTSIRGKYR